MESLERPIGIGDKVIDHLEVNILAGTPELGTPTVYEVLQLRPHPLFGTEYMIGIPGELTLPEHAPWLPAGQLLPATR